MSDKVAPQCCGHKSHITQVETPAHSDAEVRVWSGSHCNRQKEGG